MGRGGNLRRRRMEIHLTHKRRGKISKLKKQYQGAKSEDQRKLILQKLWKISPGYPVQGFLEPAGAPK